jgi:GPH family glycoside/pentoside/hexuronide:cation symporter
MAVDNNEFIYGKKLVAFAGGAIGFGSKVGNGLGSLLLSGFLLIGAYDATAKVLSTQTRWAIYGFANYLPLVLNVLMFFIFRGFDLEKKLPAIQQTLRERHTQNSEGESSK